MGSATDLRFPLSAVVHAPAEPFGTAPGLPRAQKGRFAARREEPAKVIHLQTIMASVGVGASSCLARWSHPSLIWGRGAISLTW